MLWGSWRWPNISFLSVQLFLSHLDTEQLWLSLVCAAILSDLPSLSFFLCSWEVSLLIFSKYFIRAIAQPHHFHCQMHTKHSVLKGDKKYSEVKRITLTCFKRSSCIESLHFVLWYRFQNQFQSQSQLLCWLKFTKPWNNWQIFIFESYLSVLVELKNLYHIFHSFLLSSNSNEEKVQWGSQGLILRYVPYSPK